MTYYYLKALHIIFVITWFAGLFYIVRLFIYHSEANELSEPRRSILIDQYKIMERRLWYGITWPSAIITLILGATLISYNLPLENNSWLITKLAFLFGLYVYHFSCGHILKKFKHDQIKYTSFHLRVWNEVSTLFLFAIIFLAVVKSIKSLYWGVFGLFFLGLILMTGVKFYKKIRETHTHS